MDVTTVGNSNTTASPSMWQCATCGVWVIYGCFHVCNVPVQTQPYTWPVVVDVTDHVLRDELTRVRVLLEKIAKHFGVD